MVDEYIQKTQKELISKDFQKTLISVHSAHQAALKIPQMVPLKLLGPVGYIPPATIRPLLDAQRTLNVVSEGVLSQPVRERIEDLGRFAKSIADLYSNSSTSAMLTQGRALEGYLDVSQLDRLGRLLQKLNDFQKSVLDDHKMTAASLAEKGWLLHWFSFNSYWEDGQSEDEYMISNIDEYWEDLKEKAYSLCGNRKKYLETIFDLHERREYLASIPLAIIQADGICSEDKKIGHFFYAKRGEEKAPKKIVKKYDADEFIDDRWLDVLVESLKVSDSPWFKITSKVDEKYRGMINRNGILHGSEEFLGYESELNGYKSISLLMFVIFLIKEIINNK